MKGDMADMGHWRPFYPSQAAKCPSAPSRIARGGSGENSPRIMEVHKVYYTPLGRFNGKAGPEV